MSDIFDKLNIDLKNFKDEKKLHKELYDKICTEQSALTRKYFKENKDATPINPTMGELNKQEWTIFHNKHFEHHFKQFNLT